MLDASVPRLGRGEIKPLTSLRGIAAMAVVMQHFSATAQVLCRTTIPSLVPHGYVAVDFFFVLSGFIMCYTYLDSFRPVSWAALRSFLVKRVARLMPLHSFAVCAVLLLSLLSIAASGHNIFVDFTPQPFDIAGNLLMLQGLGIGRNLNGPSWSVSAEFAAYFLFPLFVLGMFEWGRVVRGVMLAVALSMVFYIASLHPRLGLGSEDPAHAVFRCFGEFILGMAAYRLYLTPRIADRLADDRVCAALLLGAVVSLVLRLDLPAALLFPFIVAGVAGNTGTVARLLAHPVPYFLGVVSYSIYLIHGLFRPLELALVQSLHPTPIGPVSSLALALAGSLSVVPFAWLTFTYVERPARGVIRHIGRRAAVKVG